MTRRYSPQALAQAVDLARRNIDTRAFRRAQLEMLEQQLEEAAMLLRELPADQRDEGRAKG
jgi:hypothetical protein